MRLPPIAEGKIIPDGIKQHLLLQKKEEEIRKQSTRHDWKIASFGVVGGGVMGLITSFIFWICTK